MAEIPIPKPWILKEQGEVINSGWDLKCFRVRRNYILEKRKRKDIIKIKCLIID